MPFYRTNANSGRHQFSAIQVVCHSEERGDEESAPTPSKCRFLAALGMTKLHERPALACYQHRLFAFLTHPSRHANDPSPRFRRLSLQLMKTLSLLAILVSAAACAAPSTVAIPAPAPVPVPVTAPSATPPAEAPRNWQLLDQATDGVPGISAERALHELLSGKQPARTVLVAVIDGGIDTAHVDLRANLWTNPKEVAGNGRDDDNNGYVDDLHGWNFIGGKDGNDVHYDTFQVTRLYGWCTNSGVSPG